MFRAKALGVWYYNNYNDSNNKTNSLALSTCRSLKTTLSNCGDFELMFTQIQQCVNMCPADQIQVSQNPCKLSYFTLVLQNCAIF